jgi:RNA polymerase sigma-70 factor (ECF subfamily)
MRARGSDGAEMLRRSAPPAAPALSQADIVQGIIGGQRWAHAALYDRLLPTVLAALQKILRDPTVEHEDLVQTTFERIVRTLVQKNAAPISNLAGWAAAIAAHVALDELRARIRERKVFSRDDDSRRRAEHSAVGPNLERELDARHHLAWIQATLARMNPDQAETLLLHDVLGHDLAETAALSGVSIAAAQKRLSRAREELVRRAKRGGGAP